jgi:ABC-type polysaccharide/polyol phosphate transport system ATPase subunit
LGFATLTYQTTFCPFHRSFDGLEVLKDINFLFEVGQRVAIIGQNG